MDEDDATKQRDTSRRQAKRKLAVVSAGLFGGLLSLVVVVLVMTLNGRQSMPRLTRDRLVDATRRWQSTRPEGYDIVIELLTKQTEVHRVEVRDGHVQSYSRNGVAMQRRRTFDTWSVSGMFSTIERDMENVERVAAGKADQFTPRLTLWGTFDPQYGFPESYRRVQWGSNMEVSWKVVEFTVIAD